MTHNGDLAEDGICIDRNSSAHMYLFTTLYGEVIFVQIEEELKQLNNYCWLITESVDKKLNDLKTRIDEKERKPNKVIGKFEDMEITNDDTLIGLTDVELPTWTDTQKFILPATCIVLLYIFVEKSLKALVTYMKEKNKEILGNPKQKQGQSKVEAYIDFLAVNYFRGLKIDQDTLGLIKKSQRIRNAYAHGDWDEIKYEINAINLRNAFETISNYFHRIEKIYESNLQ